MARKITDYNGQITAPDSDYPDGRIKDSTGFNDGTFYDETAYGDIQQFFMKLMRLAGITHNGNPDNETNGFQFIESLFKTTRQFGERINFDRSISLVVSSNHNPVVFITPGAPDSGDIQFEDSSTEQDLRTITVINKSSHSVDIFPSSLASDTVVGGASTTVAAGVSKTFLLDKTAANWILYHTF